MSDPRFTFTRGQFVRLTAAAGSLPLIGEMRAAAPASAAPASAAAASAVRDSASTKMLQLRWRLTAT